MKNSTNIFMKKACRRVTDGGRVVTLACGRGAAYKCANKEFHTLNLVMTLSNKCF